MWKNIKNYLMFKKKEYISIQSFCILALNYGHT